MFQPTHHIGRSPVQKIGADYFYKSGVQVKTLQQLGAVRPLPAAKQVIKVKADHLRLVLQAHKTRQMAFDEWGNSAVALSTGEVRLHVKTKDGDQKRLFRVPETFDCECEIHND